MRYIHLSRQDKLAEAVSYLRAEQTGLWHGRPDGTDLEKIAPTMPEGYDADALTQRMTELTAWDNAWKQWFEENSVIPLRLTYEGLAEDPQNTLAQVLVYIGQDPEIARDVSPGVRKLADEISAGWITRYRQEHPGA